MTTFVQLACERVLAQILLNHPGPFVVVEKTSTTVTGPFATIGDALAGMEAWREELDGFDHPPELVVEALFPPVERRRS